MSLPGQPNLLGRSTSSSGGGTGTPGGSNTQVQFNDSSSFGGSSLFTFNKTTGVVTEPGSVVSAPAAITLTANAGTLDITRKYSSVTITANSTLTPSAAGASGQTCSIYVTNSDGTNSFTLTVDNTGTDYTATVPASSSRWLTYVSNATDWVLSQADPASASVATTSRVQLQNPTSGAYFYDTVANTVNASHLGTFASPNTAAGAITWTAPVYNIYCSASGALRTYTLPAASSYSGQAFILNVVAGTNHVNVQPASGAALVLAGTLLTANHYVQAATSAAGNYICFISDGTNWTSLGSSGTWADAASA